MMRRVALSALLAVPAAAHAGDFKGEAAAGLLMTSGNSESQSLNGKVAVDYLAAPWKNIFSATAINNGSDDGRTAERYTASNQLNYDLDPDNYLFGVVDWEKDRFGAYNQRTSEAVGYGRHILKGPVHILDAEIGGGMRQQEEQETGDKNSEGIVRGSGKYTWKISETSAFAQALKVEYGKDNTFSESITELKMTVVGTLFASLSFTVHHNSHAPADTDKTDTFTAVNLGYAFGA
jgi:putative salt-induced outer membrane protein